MNPYFTFEFRSCLDPFNASICLEISQAKYVTSAFHSELKYEKLAAAFFKIRSTHFCGCAEDGKEMHKVM